MKNYLVAFALLGTIVSPAFAEQTQPVSPSSEVMHVTVDWANLQNSVNALIQANQLRNAELLLSRQDAAALDEYWKQYVAGLKPTK